MNNVNALKTGFLIKKLRVDNSLSQIDLALSLNVTVAAISQWESGSGIKTEMLYNISKFFNITVSELISGKLKAETNEEFLKRNYSLDRYGSNDSLDENIDKQKEYISRLLLVKKEFYNLLLKWPNNSLSDIEKETFEFLYNYFTFDSTYYYFIKYGKSYSSLVSKEEQKEFVNMIINKYSSCSIEEYEWEVSKIFDFNYSIKDNNYEEIFNQKILEYYLLSLSTIDKDFLLTKTLYSISNEINYTEEHYIDKIENNPYIVIMVKAGCRLIKSYNTKDNILSEDIVKYFDGKVDIKPILASDSCFYFENGKLSQNYKHYSYKEYENSIDLNKTRWIGKLILDKDSSPVEYFKYISTIDDNL